MNERERAVALKAVSHLDSSIDYLQSLVEIITEKGESVLSDSMKDYLEGIMDTIEALNFYSWLIGTGNREIG